MQKFTVAYEVVLNGKIVRSTRFITQADNGLIAQHKVKSLVKFKINADNAFMKAIHEVQKQGSISQVLEIRTRIIDKKSRWNVMVK